VLVRADHTSSSPDYSPAVVDHFDQPRNVGRLEPAPDVITARAGKREQGVEFAVSARIAADRIAAARFEVYGCPHCIAAASWLSERLVGRTRADLEAWSWREAVAALQIPAEKRGRLLILEDALRALAEAWRQQS
jgi:NifU-like protein involved in Fe-S cluster formation